MRRKEEKCVITNAVYRRQNCSLDCRSGSAACVGFIDSVAGPTCSVSHGVRCEHHRTQRAGRALQGARNRHDTCCTAEYRGRALVVI